MDNQAKPDSLSSEISSVGGAVPTSPIGYIGNSRGRIAEVVRGAAPTSPPLRQKECPQDELSHRGCATCEGAGVIYVIDWQLEGAAPTSTPLDALIAKWRELAQRAWGWADEAEKQNDGANAHAFRKERRIWNTCADELEKRLAASPASALVTGENK
jgi:hypothetical protein